MDDRGQRSSVYHFNKKETETRTKTFIFKTKSVFFQSQLGSSVVILYMYRLVNTCLLKMFNVRMFVCTLYCLRVLFLLSYLNVFAIVLMAVFFLIICSDGYFVFC